MWICSLNKTNRNIEIELKWKKRKLYNRIICQDVFQNIKRWTQKNSYKSSLFDKSKNFLGWNVLNAADNIKTLNPKITSIFFFNSALFPWKRFKQKKEWVFYLKFISFLLCITLLRLSYKSWTLALPIYFTSHYICSSDIIWSPSFPQFPSSPLHFYQSNLQYGPTRRRLSYKTSETATHNPTQSQFMSRLTISATTPAATTTTIATAAASSYLHHSREGYSHR